MPIPGQTSPGYTDVLADPAARGASGSSSSRDGFGAADVLRAQLDVTAFAGTTPTLDVVLEDTLDDVNWNVIGTFAQKTGVGREVINVTAPFTDRVRARWTVGGTGGPSFTFSVRVYSE